MAREMDEAAFRGFVHARYDALSRTAYLLTGDRHLAEDLVQTALYKAARVWSRIDGDPEPYVRRILYNENISRWRRRRVVEVPTEHPPRSVSSNVPDEAGDVSLRVTLADALRRLTVKQRTVLVLRFFEDLSESQTASVMGVSVGTVKSQTRHSLDRLRNLAPELAELVDASDTASRAPARGEPT